MKTFYIRNNQPHIQPIGATFSVTMLVKDAVPKPKIDKLREDRERAIEEIKNQREDDEERLLFAVGERFDQKLEDLLNAYAKQTHPLRDSQAAKIVMDWIHRYDGKYYQLDAFCVMSNHVHLLLDFSIQVPPGWDGKSTIEGYKQLGKVLGQIKGGSGNAFSHVFGGHGLWAIGYYDRYIRSGQHFLNALAYIMDNPIKAGIVKAGETFPYLYVRRGLLE